MKNAGNSQGFIRIVLVLGIVVLLVFIGFSLVKPYINYYTLSSQTHDLLEMEIGNVERIKQRVMEMAREYGVPLDENDLEVKIDQKIVRVNASWTEVVDFFGFYQVEIDFDMEEEY